MAAPYLNVFVEQSPFLGIGDPRPRIVYAESQALLPKCLVPIPPCFPAVAADGSVPAHKPHVSAHLYVAVGDELQRVGSQVHQDLFQAQWVPQHVGRDVGTALQTDLNAVRL